MKFKTISKEDLEVLPFDDIAYIILKEKGKNVAFHFSTCNSKLYLY